MNPIVLGLYGVLAYNIHLLARYGEKRIRIPIIILVALVLLGWFIWTIYQKQKNKDKVTKDKAEKSVYNKVYLVFAVGTILGISIFTGRSLYQSAQAGQGQLFYYFYKYQNEKKLSFEEKNIYENGLDGIFDTLEEKFDLPEELYIGEDFLINFEKDGRITAFDGQFYGKNEAGESEDYMISYNEEQSDKMTVYLNSYYEETYAEDKKLVPLFEILERVSLEEAATRYLEDEYRLTYNGIFYRGSVLGDTYWIQESGASTSSDLPASGYTLHLYGRSRETNDLFAHYVYAGAKTMTDDEFELKWAAEKEPVEWEIGYNNHEGVESYLINEELGYQLSIVDAALGKRYYELLETKDGGESWDAFNPDPFLGEAGGSAGITFIDESLGFIALSKQSGTRAILYRTVDGGESYEKVSFPTVEVPLIDNETYEAFTFPGMPFEEEGKLYVLVGQGAEGDYKGGIYGLFVSTNRGETWEYLGEQWPGE